MGAQDTSILRNDFIQKKIWHHLPSGPGYSGGPILSEELHVVGLHKGAKKKKGASSFNWGVLVNHSMISNLRKWES